jgi:DNA-binding CsgD family transcriptional regulator
LMDALPRNEINDLLKDRHHIGHTLVVIKQHEHYCEKIFFGASDNNAGILNTYLNHRPTFDNFITYFKEKAIDLINLADQSRTICNPIDCHETVLTSPLPVSESLFPFPNMSPFTAKEKECAAYLAQCLSLKGIADKMDISPRTLEKHIARLKIKLGCKNLISLVVNLRSSYEFNY